MPEVLDKPKVIEDKLKERLNELKFEPMWQVILYNDSNHTQEEVLKDLIKVFNHTTEIAIKIIQEIELNSKGIADVLEKERALQCVDLLKSAHYTITAEPIC